MTQICFFSENQMLTVTAIFIKTFLLKNDNVDEVDGKIISAYFTGTAGLLGRRSHIADLLLFRIKAAVLKILTHPTYTSVLASWKILNKKKK